MVKIVAEVPKGNKPAPLLEGNLRDGGFHPASMKLTSTGRLAFSVNYDGTYSFSVARGLDHVWSFPPELTPKEIRGFVREIRPLLRKILKGQTTTYNTYYELYGHLDADAQEAKTEIEYRCNDLFDAVRCHDLGVISYDADDYFSTESLDDYGLSENSDEKAVRKAARSFERHLRREKIVMNADVFQAMKKWVEYEREK